MKISERSDDGAEVKVRGVDGTGVVLSAEKVRSRHCDGSGESFSGGIAMTALGHVTFLFRTTSLLQVCSTMGVLD